MTKSSIRNKLIILSVIIALIAVASVSFMLAYFSSIVAADKSIKNEIEVNELFGQLDNYDAAVEWGDGWGNPYVICEEQHLKNLYLLQNVRSAQNDRQAFGTDTYFQVSNEDGTPCAIGGDSSAALFEIPSIGSEDYPFIANLRGVTGGSIRLSSGEYTDTSAFSNIRVTGYEGQIDIGLFGVIGDGTNVDAAAEADAVGSVTDMLLHNVQIATNTIGKSSEDHPYYSLGTTAELGGDHETNHIGVLAGHAQNSLIKNISVYYSGTETPGQGGADGSSQSDVEAIIIAAGDTARYTSSGGIIGYYKNIYVGDPGPVSTESHYDKSTGGGNTIGSGTGVMFSDDLWTMLENSTGGELPNDSYNLQESFDYRNEGDLYYGSGSGKTYFTRGVFSFAHSFQLSAYDRVTKLWTQPDSTKFTVAADGNYTERDEVLSSAKKFACTRVTSLTAEPINTSASSGYRYLIVYTYNNTDYVLTRSANTVSTQQLVLEEENNTKYITIADPQIKLYSAKVTTPYTPTATTWYDANRNGLDGNNSYVTNNNYDNDNTRGLAFYYGPYENEIEADANGRPLRAYSDGLTYADVTGTASIPRFYLSNATGTGDNVTFRLKRARNNFSINYTAASGFTYASSWGGGKLFAVYRIDTNAAIDASNIRKINEPANSENAHTYDDMNKRVLFYRGSNYDYDMLPVSSLAWGDENLDKIEQIDTSFVMADPVTYYNYLNGDNYGLTPVTLSSGTRASVPKGSVAFQIQGTGVVGDTANINIIVATNPALLENQTIACSYFNPNVGSGNDQTTQVASFPLPPAPGSTSSTPIRLWDEEQGFANLEAYTNFNTVLVAYSLNVPCNYSATTARTYFLESTAGAASFVYFSVDRASADKARNPDHENQLFFATLSSIDYVYSMPISGNNRIVTVTDFSYYVQSLIMPYFGYLRDESTEEIDDFVIANNYNLSFSVRRTWVQSGSSLTQGYGEFYITATGDTSVLDPPPQHVDFTECVYIYTEAGLTAIVFADHVIIVRDNSSPAEYPSG